MQMTIDYTRIFVRRNAFVEVFGRHSNVITAEQARLNFSHALPTILIELFVLVIRPRCTNFSGRIIDHCPADHGIMRQTFFTHDRLVVFCLSVHLDTILGGFLFHISGELRAAAVSVILVLLRPALIQCIRFRCSLVSGFHRNLADVRAMFLPLLRFTSHQAHHLRCTFPTHIASPPAAGSFTNPV